MHGERAMRERESERERASERARERERERERERDLHDCAELSMRNAGAGVTIVGLGDELLSLRLAHYHYFNIIDSVINYIVLLLLVYYYCYWSCRSAPLLALHVCVCA